MSTATEHVSQIDLFSDDVIEQPYGVHRQLRDTATTVWTESYGYWTVTRYADVDTTPNYHEVFSPASGIGLNDALNSLQTGVLLAEPPAHPMIRRVLSSRLTPQSLLDEAPEFRAPCQ